MSEEIKKQPNILNILGYSLLLPVIWLSTGFVLSLFLEKSLGAMGVFFVIYITVTIISWLFTRKYKRHLNKTEKTQLILLMTIWASLNETLALMYYTSLETTPAMSDNGLLSVILFTIVIDLIYMSLGVHFVGKRMSDYFLKRMNDQSIVSTKASNNELTASVGDE